MAAHERGDLMIFMTVKATPSQIADVRDQLLADSAVTGVVFATQAETLTDFRCQFADQPDLEATVTADILPSTFRLDVPGGTEAVSSVQQRYRSQPGVSSVLSPDAVASGTAPTTSGMAFSDPSPVFTSDCPLTGTILK